MYKATMMLFHYSVFWLSPIFLPILVGLLKNKALDWSYLMAGLFLGLIPAWLTACYSNAVKQKAWNKDCKFYKLIWMLKSILMGGFVSFIYAELILVVFARGLDLYGGRNVAIYGMICAGISCVILLMIEWCWLKWRGQL